MEKGRRGRSWDTGQKQGDRHWFEVGREKERKGDFGVPGNWVVVPLLTTGTWLEGQVSLWKIVSFRQVLLEACVRNLGVGLGVRDTDLERYHRTNGHGGCGTRRCSGSHPESAQALRGHSCSDRGGGWATGRCAARAGRGGGAGLSHTGGIPVDSDTEGHLQASSLRPRLSDLPKPPLSPSYSAL